MKLDICLPDCSRLVEIEIDKNKIVWESNTQLDIYAAANVVAKLSAMFSEYAVKSFIYNNDDPAVRVKAVLENVQS